MTPLSIFQRSTRDDSFKICSFQNSIFSLIPDLVSLLSDSRRNLNFRLAGDQVVHLLDDGKFVSQWVIEVGQRFLLEKTLLFKKAIYNSAKTYRRGEFESFVSSSF